MFVGYAVDHDGDCYEMLDVNSGTIYVTRDIVWLKRMYFSKPLNDDDDDDGVYLPVHLPSAIGARESNPLPSNDPNEKEASLDDVDNGAMTTGVDPNEKEASLDDVDDGAMTTGVAEGKTTTNDATATTRAGRSVKAPAYLNDYELGNGQYEIRLTS
jgi:hypothetical protein